MIKTRRLPALQWPNCGILNLFKPARVFNLLNRRVYRLISRAILRFIGTMQHANNFGEL